MEVEPELEKKVAVHVEVELAMEVDLVATPQPDLSLFDMFTNRGTIGYEYQQSNIIFYNRMHYIHGVI